MPGDLSATKTCGPLDQVSETLLAAIARLPEREKIVVMLKYFDGHSVTEIAEMIGRPIGTITVQLSRARKRLRSWLKEFES